MRLVPSKAALVLAVVAREADPCQRSHERARCEIYVIGQSQQQSEGDGHNERRYGGDNDSLHGTAKLFLRLAYGRHPHSAEDRPIPGSTERHVDDRGDEHGQPVDRTDIEQVSPSF